MHVWLIALTIWVAFFCALAVLVLLAARRVAALDEAQTEAFGDWANVPERFAPSKHTTTSEKTDDL